MSRILLIFGFLLGSLNASYSQTTSIKVGDVYQLLGDWSGTLTYVDYSSGNPYTMPCDVTITSKQENRVLSLKYTYPNEPGANSRDKIKISKNKEEIDGKKIISRIEKNDGEVEVVTEYVGKDGNDNKKALIRNIYIIGKAKLTLKKEVLFENEDEWILRNAYNFKRAE